MVLPIDKYFNLGIDILGFSFYNKNTNFFWRIFMIGFCFFVSLIACFIALALQKYIFFVAFLLSTILWWQIYAMQEQVAKSKKDIEEIKKYLNLDTESSDTKDIKKDITEEK
jgi:cobalamin biosynthesis protein CobD/CbiB